jgi:hypothetical protein
MKGFIYRLRVTHAHDYSSAKRTASMDERVMIIVERLTTR